MRPRGGDVAVVVAGQVIADRFTLLDSAGNEAAELNGNPADPLLGAALDFVHDPGVGSIVSRLGWNYDTADQYVALATPADTGPTNEQAQLALETTGPRADAGIIAKGRSTTHTAQALAASTTGAADAELRASDGVFDSAVIARSDHRIQLLTPFDGRVEDEGGRPFPRMYDSTGNGDKPLIYARTITTTTDSSGFVSVTFSPSFAATPVITTTVRTSLDRHLVVDSAGPTGATLRAYFAGSTLNSAAIAFYLIAIGPAL